jgi:DNA polymerase
VSHLHIDFETRSAVVLKKCGADVYSRHQSTDILCIGYAFDDEAPWVWANGSSHTLIHLFDYVEKGGPVIAHNAHFELLIWNEIGVKQYGWPKLKPEQMICTMAMAYAMALPGSLEQAAAAAGIDQKKDMEGHRIMRQLSKPKSETICLECMGEGWNSWPHTPVGISPPKLPCTDCNSSGKNFTWHTDPEKYQRLYDYCKQDIEVERELFKRLMQLSPKEKDLWVLDYKINQRGIRIDLRAVETAIELVNLEKKRLDDEMRKVTSGAVATCTAVGQISDWLKSCGVEVNGVAKGDVVDLLNDPTLPPQCRKALLLRQEAAKSSTAKLKAMLIGVCPDGRARGILQYSVASTGRWGGRRIQTQNLPRPSISQEDISSVFTLMAGAQ